MQHPITKNIWFEETLIIFIRKSNRNFSGLSDRARKRPSNVSINFEQCVGGLIVWRFQWNRWTLLFNCEDTNFQFNKQSNRAFSFPRKYIRGIFLNSVGKPRVVAIVRRRWLLKSSSCVWNISLEKVRPFIFSFWQGNAFLPSLVDISMADLKICQRTSLGKNCWNRIPFTLWYFVSDLIEISPAVLKMN